MNLSVKSRSIFLIMLCSLCMVIFCPVCFAEDNIDPMTGRHSLINSSPQLINQNVTVSALSGKRILFVNDNPSNGWGYTISNRHSMLANALTAKGYVVEEKELNPITAEDINLYDAILFSSYLVDREISQTEADIIRDYVNNGGGLFLVTENRDLPLWNNSFNKIGQYFGILTNKDLLIGSISLGQHEITSGVTGMWYQAGSTLSVSGLAKAIGTINGSPALAYTDIGSGRVVATGDMNSFDNSYVKDINLFVNIFDWLIQGGGLQTGTIVANPENPIVGQAVDLDASAVATGGLGVSGYNWFFGDGNSAIGLTSPATTHTYQGFGKYLVTLQVKLTDNTVRSYSKEIIVGSTRFNISASTFNFGKSGESDTLKGPEITFAGKTFNLFNMPIGTELQLVDAVKVKYDPEEHKYEMTFGSLGADAKDYQAVKTIVNRFGKTTNRDFYNQFRSIQSGLKAKKIKMGIEYTEYAAGYMEFSDINGDPVLTEGGLIVVAKATGSVSGPFSFCPVAYWVFRVEGEVDGKLVFKLVNSGQYIPDAQLGLNVTADLGAGIGNESIANVEAGLEGEIETKVDLPLTSLAADFTAKLTGYLYLKYHVLLFVDGKNTWKFAGVQLYPWQGGIQALSIEPDGFKLMSRDYLGGGRMTIQSLNSNIIKSSVFPYGEPQLLPLGSGKQLLIWVDDNPARSSANRTSLMYSVFNGSSWSAPSYVNDDGTSDFAPRAMALNGQAYLTWQNANTTFADTVTLEEMAQGMDIGYARFDGASFTDITNLTPETDAIFELAPVVSASGSEVTVAWIENSANDSFGLSGTDTIKSRKASNGSWEAATILVGGTLSITSMDSGYHNGVYCIAYSADNDGNKGEIYFKNGPSLIKVTTDTVDDRGVQFVQQGNTAELYWQAGEAIKYVNPSSISTVNDLGIAADANQMRNLHILANDNGGRALLWEQSDGFKNELYGDYYNSGTSTWGAPIKLTGFNNKIRQSSAYLDNNNNIQTAFDLAQVLELNEANSEPYGTTDLMVATIGRDTNISIEGGAYYDPSQIVPGAIVNLGLNVRNNSADPVTQVETDILDAGGATLATQTISTSITSGASQEIVIPYSLPGTISKQDLTLQVKPIGLSDIDMTDNQTTVTIGLADAAIVRTAVLGGNTPNQIQVDIQNIGYDGAANLVATLRKDSSDGEVLATQSIPTLAVSASQTLTFDLNPGWLTFASERDNKLFYVGLTSESPEGLYSNNGILVVVSPPHVTAVILDQTSLALEAGNSVMLLATVNPSEAVNQSVLWVSADETIATVDQSGLVKGLKAGQTTIVAASFDGNQMANCTVTVTGINPALSDFVTRFYQLCLQRTPDAAGLAYWIDQLATGQQTGANVAQNFIFSDEFITRNLSDSDFLNIMYSTFFNRTADSGGKAYWQDELINGKSRLYVLASFVNSPEFEGVCSSYGITPGSISLTDPVELNPQVAAFVTRFYALCLDRQPDSGGLNYWVEQLVTGAQTGADLSQGFIFSPEFTAKNLNNSDFVTVMYRVFFDREPDSGGQTYWVGVLDSGTSRLQVLAGFVGSNEFAVLCSSIGIPVGVVQI